MIWRFGFWIATVAGGAGEDVMIVIRNDQDRQD